MLCATNINTHTQEECFYKKRLHEECVCEIELTCRGRYYVHSDNNTCVYRQLILSTGNRIMGTKSLSLSSISHNLSRHHYEILEPFLASFPVLYHSYCHLHFNYFKRRQLWWRTGNEANHSLLINTAEDIIFGRIRYIGMKIRLQLNSFRYIYTSLGFAPTYLLVDTPYNNCIWDSKHCQNEEDLEYFRSCGERKTKLYQIMHKQ